MVHKSVRTFALIMACLLAGRGWSDEEISPTYAYQDETKIVFTAPSPVLSSVVAAPVRKVHYRFGESFSKGDPLVMLDDTLYLANVEAAKAAYTAECVKSEALESLYKEGNATLVDRERAVGMVKVAYKNLVEAREKLNGCQIRAPFSGRVVELFVEEHELVEMGRPLLRVVNDSTLLAQFLLEEKMFGQIKTGIAIKILVTATQKEIEGTIKYISAEVDPASATFEVRAEVDNHMGLLRTGMNARLNRSALNAYLR